MNFLSSPFGVPGPLGMLVLMVVVPAIVIYRSRRPVVAEPSCTRCGYIVHGLSSLTCPECGTDLRQGGIWPGGIRRRMDRLNWLLLWSLLVLLAAPTLTGFLQDTILPWTFARSTTRFITCQSDCLNTTLQLKTEGQTLLFGIHPMSTEIPSQTQTLSCTNAGKTTTLQISLPTRRYQYDDWSGRVTPWQEGLDAKAIAAWLRASGYESDDHRFLQRAGDILEAINLAPDAENGLVDLGRDIPNGWPPDQRDRVHYAVTMYSGACSATMTPLGQIPSVRMTFWATVWLAGTLWLLLYLRPRLRRIDPRCGPCGAAVEATTGTACATCGSDLREVGIITTWMRRVKGPATAWLLWTIGCPAVVLFLTMVAMNFLGPHKLNVWLHRNIYCRTATDDLLLCAKAIGSRAEWGRPDWTLRPVAPQQVTLTLLDPPGRVSPLHLDLEHSTAEFIDSNGRHVPCAGGLNAETIATWLTAAGIDAAAPQWNGYWNHIAEFLTRLNSDPDSLRWGERKIKGYTAMAAFSSDSATLWGHLLWTQILQAALWLAAWLGGLVWLRRRSASSTAFARRTPQAPTSVVR